MPFRDVLDIRVQGGRGGDGAMSFLRLKYVPKGGPDGGHGGDGGDVWLVAVDDVTALDRLIPGKLYRGGTGMQGEGRNKHGASGDDLVLEVPVGTLVLDRGSGAVLGDLLEVGQRLRVAEGGEGGRGNASFASAQRRAPRFAEYGTRGATRSLRLELRTIADAGLVGYPNAGKSSLLAALSNARPVIAEYPFTTLTPNLGVIERDMERVTLADIPGIIEDAHKGKGLGFEFLRHISRTRLLVYVLDIAADPVANLEALQHELRAYDPGLLQRPALVVVNKTDLAGAGEVVDAVDAVARFGLPVVAASALEGEHLDAVKDALFALLPAVPELEPTAVGATTVVADPVRVEKDADGVWVVLGSEIRAIVERFDTRNHEAVAYLQHHFRQLGVDRLLKRAGAEDGDDVRIGEAVFEYFDEDRERERQQAERAERATGGSAPDAAPDAPDERSPEAGDPS